MPPPPKKADPPHKLTFTTNSLRNTTIAVDNDALYYEVVTRFWHPHVTKIRKLDTDTQELVTVAELERVPGREPRLRFVRNTERAPLRAAACVAGYGALEETAGANANAENEGEPEVEWIPASHWLAREPEKV